MPKLGHSRNPHQQDRDPVITLQLTNIDIDSIVDSAKVEDSHGTRMQKARELLLAELDIETARDFPIEHEFLWRGTKRHAEISLMNVREMSDSTLRPSGKDWLLVIDLPLDRDGHGPADDLSRIQKYRAENTASSKTVIWLPAFLSERTQSDLGRLVVLDYLLNPKMDRLRDHASHLPAVERAEAHKILASNQESLRERLRIALRQAYGVAQFEGGVIDETRTLETRDQFQSIWPGFQLAKPVAGKLAEAMNGLLAQALEFEFPAHPKFADIQIIANRWCRKRSMRPSPPCAIRTDARQSTNADFAIRFGPCSKASTSLTWAISSCTRARPGTITSNACGSRTVAAP